VHHGWREGRSPSPLFDVQAYLAAYPGVRATNQEPLAHFLKDRRRGEWLDSPDELTWGSSKHWRRSEEIYRRIRASLRLGAMR
jgi:hypothetical protein